MTIVYDKLMALHRRDFSRAVPETFAMVGWSTGRQMVAVDVAIAHRGPIDVAGWSMVGR